MSLFFSTGSPTTEMSPDEIRAGVFQALSALGERKRVLAVPPERCADGAGVGVLRRQARRRAARAGNAQADDRRGDRDHVRRDTESAVPCT